RNVVIDRCWKGIPALKNHANALPEGDNIRATIIHVCSVPKYRAFLARPGNRVVHSVDRSEECRFTASRRANQRGDAVWLDRKRHVEQCLLLSIEEGEVDSLDRPCCDGTGVGLDGQRTHPNLPVMYASVRGSLGAVNSVFVDAASINAPSSMNAVRSETRAACCMLWVTIPTVTVERSS